MVNNISFLLLLFINFLIVFRIHYLNYIHWVRFQKDVWVYPILNQLPFIYRGIFLLVLIVLATGLYFLGEIYTSFLTGRR